MADVQRRRVHDRTSGGLCAALVCLVLVASAVAVAAERDESSAAPPAVADPAVTAPADASVTETPATPAAPVEEEAPASEKAASLEEVPGVPDATANEPSTDGVPRAEPAEGIAAEDPDAVPSSSLPPNVSQSTEVFEIEAGRAPDGVLERHLVPPQSLAAGDELRYAIRLTNDGTERIAAGRIQVQTAMPSGTRFLPGSAGGAGALVEYAVDGANFFPHVPEEEAEEAAPIEGDFGWAPPEDASAPSTAEQPDAGVAVEPSGSANAARPADVLPLADVMTSEPVLTIRWTYQQPLDPGAVAEVYFHVRLL